MVQLQEIPVRISPRIYRPRTNKRNVQNLVCIRSFRTEPPPIRTGPTIFSSVSSNSSKIKIGHLNIRSLKKRDHLLQLRSLIRDNVYDIFVVSESWLNSTVSNAEVEIQGYRLSRLDRKKKPGGGVCVYTRASLKVKILKELTELSQSGFHQLWMKIQHKNMKSILVCATYRPPDCSETRFANDLMEKYTMALTYGKDIFIVGDLNCNMLKDNQDAKVLKDLCSSLNLKQLINTPTRVTSQSSTLIDLIITSNTTLVVESGVLENHISDHFLIFTVLKLKKPKLQPKVVTARNYKYYNPEKFLKDLAQIPWCNNLLLDDVNEKVACFNANFLNTLERHAPVKTIKIRYRQCPFLNDEIKQLMKNRDKLHKLAWQTRVESDWKKFRICRESVKRKLREAERIYVQNEICNSNKSRSMWKVIRDCVPRKETTEPNYSRVEELVEAFKEAPYSFGIHQIFKLKGVLNKKTRCFWVSVCLLEHQRVIFK